jgi:hypothetical protein
MIKQFIEAAKHATLSDWLGGAVVIIITFAFLYVTP